LNFDVRPSLRMSETKGVVPTGTLVNVAGEADAPPEAKALLMQRIEARKAKDFKRSDALRDELKSRGWVIEDTPKGPRLKKA